LNFSVHTAHPSPQRFRWTSTGFPLQDGNPLVKLLKVTADHSLYVLCVHTPSRWSVGVGSRSLGEGSHMRQDIPCLEVLLPQRGALALVMCIILCLAWWRGGRSSSRNGPHCHVLWVFHVGPVDVGKCIFKL